MDELTRFARLLVERLASRAGGASNGAVSVEAIRKEILPYRIERRNLGLSSVEDYETVLLRLVAEERGFVKTVPPGAAERCRDVLAHPNPDLGVLDEIADSTIQFTSLAAAPIFEQADRRTGGPADGPTEPEAAPSSRSEHPASSPPSPPDRPSAGPPAASCPHCQHSLPAGRTAMFCPWCGERLIPLRCERCGSDVESAWRHCITCGAPVRDPYRPS